jgi:hypothetical protein
MVDEQSFDVFLSHHSDDKPAVEILARPLVDEAGLRPFLDKWHLVPGKPWQAELEEALKRLQIGSFVRHSHFEGFCPSGAMVCPRLVAPARRSEGYGMIQSY